MPCAARKKDRVVQVFNWLQSEFPLDGVRLRLTWRQDRWTSENFGWVEPAPRRGDDNLLLFLNMRGSRSVLIETLLHEYAHCMNWAVDRDRHTAGWGISFARLLTHFWDLGGRQDSFQLSWSRSP